MKNTFFFFITHLKLAKPKEAFLSIYWKKRLTDLKCINPLTITISIKVWVVKRQKNGLCSQKTGISKNKIKTAILFLSNIITLIFLDFYFRKVW